MRWTVHSPKRRTYNTLCKHGKWQQKFLWWPTVIKDSHGVKHYMWLDKVMVKCIIAYAGNDVFELKPTYRLPEEHTQELLAGNDVDDKLVFDGIFSESAFRQLKRELKIKDESVIKNQG